MKKAKKNEKKKGMKKLTLQRETLHALEDGKLEIAVGGATHCPTACSVC